MTTNSNAFESPPPEKLSALLSGYQVDTMVSTGLMGAVYEARQLSLDRKVMIKILPPSIGKDPTLRSAFEAEAKTMARLNDPNLVEIFDFGNVDGLLYIIMEHVPGRPLSDATSGSHVDQKESARLIADVCRGLSHAHKEGVVHRALAPANILINREAEPKIVDFGMAALFADSQAASDSPFTAPESKTPGANVDHRADIYSAGMILYNLVVGHLPQNPYSPPSQIRNSRPELDHICYKALQPDPDQRYSTAAEMADDLDAMLDKMGAPPTQEAIKTLVTGTSSASPATITPRPVTIPTKSNNSAAVVVSILVVAVLAGIIGLVVMNSSGTKTPEKNPTATPTPSNQPAAKPSPKPTPKPPNPKSDKNTDIAQKPKPKPKPDPQPEPKPDPTPNPDQEKDTSVADNQPDPTPQPDPEPDPTPAPPEFDREAFLDKARTFMRKRAARTLREYDDDLQKNISRFERDVKRAIRRLDRNLRKPAEIEADEAFEALRIAGRLPEKAPDDSPELIKKLYKEALQDQAKVDQEYLEDFMRYRITYLQGLDKQVLTLKNQGNDEHAEALNEEISATQKDMARFMRILRNLDPDPKPEEEEDDKKKKDKKDKDKDN